MKIDDIFEAMTDIDDRFIEAARPLEMTDISTATAKPAPRRAMWKTLVPAAAFVAVAAAAAGILVVNVGRGKLGLSENPAASVEESSEGEDAEAFVEKCKEIVTSESELIGQSETTWTTRLLDVDFDGEDELLIYPQVDKRTVPEVGVRVFKMTEDDIEDLGAFGNDDGIIHLPDIRLDERDDVGNQYYYCFSHEDKNGLREGIRFVSYSEETGTVNSDKCLMRVFDNGLTHSDYMVGVYSGEDQAFVAKIREFPEDIVEMFCEFNDEEIASCENDALTRNGKLELVDFLTPGMWHVGEYDINFDGEKELLISLYNFTNMRGVFVYDSNCEYLGSFETENGLCDPELMYSIEKDGERFWYYMGIEGSTERRGGRYVSRLDRVSINKLIVENNSFSTERLIHYDIIWDKGTEDHREYWIGDKEVTEEEYDEADVYQGDCQGSHEFDLTNLEDWQGWKMFEDSLVRGLGQKSPELEALCLNRLKDSLNNGDSSGITDISLDFDHSITFQPFLPVEDVYIGIEDGALHITRDGKTAMQTGKLGELYGITDAENERFIFVYSNLNNGCIDAFMLSGNDFNSNRTKWVCLNDNSDKAFAPAPDNDTFIKFEDGTRVSLSNLISLIDNS